MMFLAKKLKITAKRGHRICQVKRIYAPSPYITDRLVAEMLSLFLLGDMFASKRDILALLVLYIVASLQRDMI